MKVEIELKEDKLTLSNRTICGDLMIVRDYRDFAKEINGKVFLNCEDGFILLNNPYIRQNIYLPVMVEVLPKGTKITLTVE